MFSFTAKDPGTARTKALILTVAACLLTLTACGGGGGGDNGTASTQVASLPTSAGASGGAPSGDTGGSTDTAKRPRHRLDETPEESDALVHAWFACLVAHGAHYTPDTLKYMNAPPAPGRKKNFRAVADPIPAAAKQACDSKVPEMAPELDPAQNPHYREQSIAQIACMRKHGALVHLVADTSASPKGLSWSYDSGTTPNEADTGRISHQCELIAFGGGK